LATTEFTGGFKPRHPWDILFQHPEKGLVGVGQPPKQNGGKLTVRMEPGAAVAGRLVDAGGKPRAGVELAVRLKPKGWGGWHDYSPEPIKTDADGRFRFGTLLPGYEFELRDEYGSVAIGDGLRAGEVKDLGDVKVTPSTER
jgi:hypothetical protein